MEYLQVLCSKRFRDRMRDLALKLLLCTLLTQPCFPVPHYYSFYSNANTVPGLHVHVLVYFGVYYNRRLP